MHKPEVRYTRMIRPPFVHGKFYPSQPDKLRESVDTLLSRASNTHEYKNTVGIIVPHAGYIFSGMAAASAYNRLEPNRYKTAIIISPSHYVAFDGSSVYDGDGYESPLGTMHVDTELRDKLTQHSPGVVSAHLGHEEEHAIEVQLPFMQRIFKDIRIVPVVMGKQSVSHCKMLGHAVAEVMNLRDTIIIASSDLSHYHNSDRARVLDAVAADAIQDLDPDALLQSVASGKAEACGAGPIAAMMYASQKLGPCESEILYQCNSGDINNDTKRVVGYLSAAVHLN
jgi:MEMO1 family protein